MLAGTTLYRRQPPSRPRALKAEKLAGIKSAISHMERELRNVGAQAMILYYQIENGVMVIAPPVA